MTLVLWLACSSAPTGHDRAVAALDAEIAGLTRLAEAHPDDWARFEALAGGHQQRARQVGGFDDLAAAEDALARAFAIAPAGSGPWTSQARLDFSLHRLDRVEPSLGPTRSAC